jgi:hypothetical protein
VKGTDNFENLDIDGRIMLYEILKKQDVRSYVDWTHLVQDMNVLGPHNHTNENLGSIKRCKNVY